MMYAYQIILSMSLDSVFSGYRVLTSQVLLDESGQDVNSELAYWEMLRAEMIVAPSNDAEWSARARVREEMSRFFSGEELELAMCDLPRIRQIMGRIKTAIAKGPEREREARLERFLIASKLVFSCLPDVKKEEMDSSIYYFRGTLFNRLRVDFEGDFAEGRAIFRDNVCRNYGDTLDFARHSDPGVAIDYAQNGCGNDTRNRFDPVVIAFGRVDISRYEVIIDANDTGDLIIPVRALKGLPCQIFRCKPVLADT